MFQCRYLQTLYFGLSIYGHWQAYICACLTATCTHWLRSRTLSTIVRHSVFCVHVNEIQHSLRLTIVVRNSFRNARTLSIYHEHFRRAATYHERFRRVTNHPKTTPGKRRAPSDVIRVSTAVNTTRVSTVWRYICVRTPDISHWGAESASDRSAIRATWTNMNAYTWPTPAPPTDVSTAAKLLWGGAIWRDTSSLDTPTK